MYLVLSQRAQRQPSRRYTCFLVSLLMFAFMFVILSGAFPARGSSASQQVKGGRKPGHSLYP